MASVSNVLVEIPHSDWPKLCELYADKKLSSCAFNTLQTTINSIQQNPYQDIHIYCLNGDWTDGTFIMDDHSFVIFNTLSASHDRLLIALKCLDINVNYLFYGFSEHFLPSMKQYFNDSGIEFDYCQKLSSLWYHIPKDKIDQFVLDSPTGITLTPLTFSHVKAITEVFPERMDDTEKFVERLIQNNEGVGAFNEEGHLMAWCLQLPIGCIGMMQVIEAHQHTNLGNLVLRSLAKILAAKNIEVMVPAVFKEIISQILFEDLDAYVVDNVYWAWKDE